MVVVKLLRLLLSNTDMAVHNCPGTMYLMMHHTWCNKESDRSPGGLWLCGHKSKFQTVDGGGITLKRRECTESSIPAEAWHSRPAKLKKKKKKRRRERLQHPTRARGTCLGLSLRSSPTRCPGSPRGATTPASSRGEVSPAANVRKRSSAGHRPHTPRPTARPLAVATLVTPERQCTGGRASFGAFLGAREVAQIGPPPVAVHRPDWRHQAHMPRLPSAPRGCRAQALAQGASPPDSPRCAQQQGSHRLPGFRASGLRLPTRPAAHFSPLASAVLRGRLSTLFSGLITFRIKAKPSPGSLRRLDLG
ncbi:uncharacterized protein LOC132653575 [Meriones unguiculatus]|uniref:uncharacterized protein LOC132653575 n=1 Tax=Meriones unguiculatus TaxID=10047 RepID=UPI00293F3B15|nr:uncharacterized protein LOC132653575 [Meriones unguiculatus]